jgi:hypothetical protein
MMTRSKRERNKNHQTVDVFNVTLLGTLGEWMPVFGTKA